MKDMKEALGNARKADTTHVRRSFQIYTSRPCEYGSEKYERGNYRRPTGGAAHTEPTKEDFERFRSYLRAARDHLDEVLDSMEMHLATDPNLIDIEGMKRAAYAVDTDTTPGAKVGPSMLPHVAPACASLNMAITQAADCGLIPRDPGTPWRAPAVKRSPLEVLDREIAAGFGDVPSLAGAGSLSDGTPMERVHIETTAAAEPGPAPCRCVKCVVKLFPTRPAPSL